MVEIQIARAVVEQDLRRIGRQDIGLIFKKIALLRTDIYAGYPLGGELTGFRKLVVGRNTYRVVYRVSEDGKSVEICEIWAVGHRRDAEVYAEATRRVREAAATRPQLLGLADLMETIDSLDTETTSRLASAPPPDPVPEWLFKQLVHTAGMAPQEVAAMTGEEAFETWNAWNAWMSRPR